MTGDILEVANLAALMGENPTPLKNGRRARLLSNRVMWRLNKLDALTLAPDSVVIANGGGAYWVREEERDPSWALQLVWRVNADTGDNDNDGKTPATAIATVTELMKRLPLKRERSYTVYVTGVMNGIEPIVLDGSADYTGFINFVGVRSQVATGSVTAFDAYNGATKQYGTITDSSKADDFWTAHLGRLVVLTSGTNADAWAFVDKSFAGTKKCRHQPFWSNEVFGVVDPGINDTYAIYTLPVEWNVRTWQFGGQFSWQDIRFALVDDDIQVVGGGAYFASCDFDVSMHEVGVSAGAVWSDFVGCRHACQINAYGGVWNYLDDPYMTGGGAQAIAHHGGVWNIFSGGLCVATRPFAYAGGVIHIGFVDLACFDLGGIHPVFSKRGGTTILDSLVYGTGSTSTYTVYIEPSATVICASPAKLPSVDTPATNYAHVGGTDRSLANMQAASFMHPTTGALFTFQG
jgi:hypothetical protein